MVQQLRACTDLNIQSLRLRNCYQLFGYDVISICLALNPNYIDARNTTYMTHEQAADACVGAPNLRTFILDPAELEDKYNDWSFTVNTHRLVRFGRRVHDVIPYSVPDDEDDEDK